MSRRPPRGIGLALFGALILTPDALFMRLSDMGSLQMLGWRGLCVGLCFLAAWAVTSQDQGADLRALGSRMALIVVAMQAANVTLFPLGIGQAPVAPVLLGVATVPVWSALFALAFYREPTRPVTWLVTLVVLAGIGWAVTEPGALLDPRAGIGAACGLGVAAALAANFVILRHNPGMPLLLVLGLGSLTASALGWAATGPANMTQGALWAILFTGIAILPVSFYALNQASRHASAANVSLLLLLETVLAPLWVWLGTGEAPTDRMLTGGGVVVLALGLYLLTRPRRPLAPGAALPRKAARSVAHRDSHDRHHH